MALMLFCRVSVFAAAVGVGSTTFVDPLGRFALELPPDWGQQTGKSGTSGVSFQREVDGVPAYAAIRVIAFSQPMTLEAFVRAASNANRGAPGFRLLEEEAIPIAGKPGVRQRFILYINGDPKWPKMVEQRMVLVGDRGFVLHGETVAEAFGTFADDFVAMFASFRPALAALPQLVAPPTGDSSLK